MWYARNVVGQAKPCLKCSEMNSTSHMMKCSSIVYNNWLKYLSIENLSIERKIEDLLLNKILILNALRSLDVVVKKVDFRNYWKIVMMRMSKSYKIYTYKRS